MRHTDYGVALSALALAAFYVGLAVWMRAWPRLAVVFEGSLAIGVVFITLTIPFALDPRSTAGAWALEGAGLVWLGFRQSRRLGRVFGYGLLVLSALVLFVTALVQPTRERLFDATLLNGFLIVAASIVGAWLVHRFAAEGASKPAIPQVEPTAEPVLIGWATLWFLFVTAVKIDAWVPATYQLAAWLTCVSSAAVLYTALSAALDWRLIAMPILGHAPLMAVAVMLGAAQFKSPIEGGGWWAWPIAVATHLLALGVAASRWPRLARNVVHWLGALVLAALGALEGRAITADWGDAESAWRWLGWLAVPAGLVFLFLRPSVDRVWPVSAAPRAYRSGAAGVLTFGLLFWALVANVASNGSAAPLPHVPLLNPLDLGVALALAGAWFWRKSDGASDGMPWMPRLVFVCVAADAFIWLNAMLIRAFHHYLGVPYHVDAWMASLAVQTGVSLLWTVTALALMWISARRGERAPWMTGAALLAAVVLKLFVIDLSGSETVTRIVSFVGVGVLMLVIGYVAPFPTSGRSHEGS